jgi:uncharacterized protein (DUF433 family)
MIKRFKTFEEFNRYKESWVMEKEQREIILKFFAEVVEFIESPLTPRFTDVHFEDISFHGDPKSLAVLFELGRHPSIDDVDVVYMQSTRHYLKDCKKTQFGLVEIVVYTNKKPRLEAILDAMRQTWPDAAAEFEIKKITDRLETNPGVMTGKAVIRGTRIPVELIAQKLDEGMTMAELLDAYPGLSEKDIAAVERLMETREWIEEVLRRYPPDELVEESRLLMSAIEEGLKIIKTRDILTKYSTGGITRSEAMRRLGLDLAELGTFAALMEQYQIPWPKPDRERAEREGEIVAAAIKEAGDEGEEKSE